MGALEMRGGRNQKDSRDGALARRGPIRILTSDSLGERTRDAHAEGNSSSGTRGRVRASATRIDLAESEDQLFGDNLDPELFVESVGRTLSDSNISVRAVLLCLDPELAVLGQLIPMHAAWRAMRSHLPVHMAPGRELCWPKHLQRPGIMFRLDKADEDDVKLRDALVRDLTTYVKARPAVLALFPILC